MVVKRFVHKLEGV